MSVLRWTIPVGVDSCECTGQWLLEEGTLLLPILALALLHARARNLYRLPTHDRAMLGLALVAAGPWLIFAVTQAQRQWRNLAGDIQPSRSTGPSSR